MDADGGIVAVGGNSDYGTSIYDSVSDSWADGAVSNSTIILKLLTNLFAHSAPRQVAPCTAPSNAEIRFYFPPEFAY